MTSAGWRINTQPSLLLVLPFARRMQGAACAAPCPIPIPGSAWCHHPPLCYQPTRLEAQAALRPALLRQESATARAPPGSGAAPAPYPLSVVPEAAGAEGVEGAEASPCG